jgi:hypothetical protein
MILGTVSHQREAVIQFAATLIGMSLLDRYKIEIEAFPGGEVRLTSMGSV